MSTSKSRGASEKQSRETMARRPTDESVVAVGAKQCPAVHRVGGVDCIGGLQETTHDIPAISRQHGHES